MSEDNKKEATQETPKEPTEQELVQKAQELYQKKVQQASQEVNEVLQKYGLTIEVVHSIELRPRTR